MRLRTCRSTGNRSPAAPQGSSWLLEYIACTGIIGNTPRAILHLPAAWVQTQHSRHFKHRQWDAGRVPGTLRQQTRSATAAAMLAAEQKSFQLVIAATRQLGIGKGGTMPWKLPADMAYFKELTSTTHDPAKMNAVVSGHPPARRHRFLMSVAVINRHDMTLLARRLSSVLSDS